MTCYICKEKIITLFISHVTNLSRTKGDRCECCSEKCIEIFEKTMRCNGCYASLDLDGQFVGDDGYIYCDYNYCADKYKVKKYFNLNYCPDDNELNILSALMTKIKPGENIHDKLSTLKKEYDALGKIMATLEYTLSMNKNNNSNESNNDVDINEIINKYF